MTEDRIEGVAKRGLGRMEDAVGGLTGDGKIQADGKLNQVKGSVQSAYGQIKDQAEDALGQAQARAKDAYGDLEGYVRDNPLPAIAISAGVGLIIGLVLRGGRKTVYIER